MPTQVFTLDDAEQLIRSTVLAVVSEYKSKPVPLVMTKRQLADYVDKPLSTINRWMKQGMPYTKEGNDYPVFWRPDVEVWLELRYKNISGKEGRTEGQELFEGDMAVS